MKSVVIVIALLGFGGVGYAKPAGRAQGGEKVDWSEYLETKSDKPLVVKSATPKASTSRKKVASKAKKPTKKRTAARAAKRAQGAKKKR